MAGVGKWKINKRQVKSNGTKKKIGKRPAQKVRKRK